MDIFVFNSHCPVDHFSTKIFKNAILSKNSIPKKLLWIFKLEETGNWNFKIDKNLNFLTLLTFFSKVDIFGFGDSSVGTTWLPRRVYKTDLMRFDQKPDSYYQGCPYGNPRTWFWSFFAPSAVVLVRWHRDPPWPLFEVWTSDSDGTMLDCDC